MEAFRIQTSNWIIDQASLELENESFDSQKNLFSDYNKDSKIKKTILNGKKVLKGSKKCNERIILRAKYLSKF